MKKVTISILLILTIILSLLSCGKWPDNIKLSTKSAEFSANGDSILITTQGDTLVLMEIIVDGKIYNNFDGIDVHSDRYTVKLDCFTFERRELNTLFIKLEPNTLNLKRIVKFHIHAGDYSDNVTITQNPK
jgi:hypothetical protein